MSVYGKEGECAMGAPRLNRYYVHVKGRTYGPYSVEQIFERAKEGRIRSSFLLWCEGMENWESAKVVLKRLKESGHAPALANLPESGIPTSAIFPKSLPANFTETPKPAQLEPASVSLRGIAVVIDGVFLGVLTLTTYFLGVDPTAIFYGGLLLFLCCELLCTAALGATPGKAILGLRVVERNGSPLSASTAIIRSIMKVVSTATLLLGYLPALFDKQNRTLHDRTAHTLVIRR